MPRATSQTLTIQQIAELLAPYLRASIPDSIYEQVSRYLDLLGRWNARVSLTSVREPAQVVQRHFGESFFLAERLPAFRTLLDLGSGAGFPGIPIALLRPSGQITLAESQRKKAAFLREAVDLLGLQAGVWADRVEQMPSTQTFEVVALRAVDHMETALLAAKSRVGAGGTLAFFAGEGTPFPLVREQWNLEEHALPFSSGRLILAKAK